MTKPILSALALACLLPVLAACGSNPDKELAALKPYGSGTLESCGKTTHGIELRELDDDVEDWSIEEASDELGPPILADEIGGIRRAGWYDITLGQANCGMMLIILERKEQKIVTVRDLKGQQIWDALNSRFPN